eukprot:TRINITY_DN4706_c0_g1_i9.p1 TRINITY_DN4706_c0_g1~~TRINITY_DN4706_c0_g1_i9.p1  ORF type:complete len:616 (+),score=104.72 TRINITY_DN4706_c0_g1_i9:54-1901(+)
MSEAINVVIRVKPTHESEDTIWTYFQKEIRDDTYAFSFDKIFSPESSTYEIFKEVALPIIDASLEGINGTIFAYGQTSSGKTHTMVGSPSCPGVIPLSIDHIFKKIESSLDREFLVRLSYMEIYNEIITDLLRPANSHLKIREDMQGPFVESLTQEFVTSVEEINGLFCKGQANRHIGETAMNEKSSRSHTVFTMVIESRKVPERGRMALNEIKNIQIGGRREGKASMIAGEDRRLAMLNLVDLAGSERIKDTRAEGVRLAEGVSINTSLLHLGTVIQSLSEKQSHIPFRQSKLTRILQPALGGNGKTAIICTVTPATQYRDDTRATLFFADKAKSIKNKPKVNEIYTDKDIIKKLKRENEILRKEIEELKEKVKNQGKGFGMPQNKENVSPMSNAVPLITINQSFKNENEEEWVSCNTAYFDNTQTSGSSKKRSREMASLDQFPSRPNKTWKSISGTPLASSMPDIPSSLPLAQSPSLPSPPPDSPPAPEPSLSPPSLPSISPVPSPPSISPVLLSHPLFPLSHPYPLLLLSHPHPLFPLSHPYPLFLLSHPLFPLSHPYPLFLLSHPWHPPCQIFHPLFRLHNPLLCLLPCLPLFLLQTLYPHIIYYRTKRNY